MKHCIIYAHPNPSSFCNALKQKVVSLLEERNENYSVIDLYADKFDPILDCDDFLDIQNDKSSEDIEKYQSLIADATHLIFIYPIWWFGQPAILKGWIDRVFSPGFAYRNDEDGFHPLLIDKKASVFFPMGSSREILVQHHMHNFMDNMIIGTLNLVGITEVNSQPFYSLPTLSDEERHALLDQLVL